jgi:hypothetical protein
MLSETSSLTFQTSYALRNSKIRMLELLEKKLRYKYLVPHVDDPPLVLASVWNCDSENGKYRSFRALQEAGDRSKRTAIYGLA